MGNMVLLFHFFFVASYLCGRGVVETVEGARIVWHVHSGGAACGCCAAVYSSSRSVLARSSAPSHTRR